MVHHFSRPCLHIYPADFILQINLIFGEGMEIKPNIQADTALVQLAKNGDPKAFEQLLSKYKEIIYYTVLKKTGNENDAEDLTMIAFSKAFQSLHSYNGAYAFSTWLFKIANNQCIDFIRLKGRKVPVSNEKEPKFEVQELSQTPEAVVINEERRQKIREMVEHLPEKYRNIIHLCYFEELTYEEIAQRTEIPSGTVKALIFRGKQLLLKLYNPDKEHY